MVSSCFFLQAAQRVPFQILIPHLHLIIFFSSRVEEMRGFNAPRRRPMLVGFEGDVAGILTDDQDFAFATHIFCEKPTLRLCVEQGFKVRKIALVERAVVVARVEQRLELAFRQLFARLEPHQGIPDAPTGNALTIPVIPVAGIRLMIHRLPPG